MRGSIKTVVRLVVFLSVASVLFACSQSTPISQPTQTVSPTGVAETSQTPSPTKGSQPTTPPQATVSEVSPERIAAGQTFADQFLNRDYAAVVAQFDATMKSVFPIDKVKEARESLEPQLGAFKRTAGTRAEKVEQNGIVYDIVYVTWEFEKAAIDLRIVFDQSGQVAGLFFQPSQSTPPAAYVAPAYVNPDAFREQEVTVGSGEWALPGTLTLPVGDGPFPVVVLVHGSGANDRDESLFSSKPFRDLAWGLASQGVAVLRYEKRNKQHASKLTEDVVAKLTVQEETVDDALAAVSLLRQTNGIDSARVFVLGHSLGGYLLPRIGISDPQIAGLISMAGSTRPLEDSLMEQAMYIVGLDGTPTPEEEAALDQVAAQVARVKDPSLSAATPAADSPFGVPAGYWLDLRGYNPAEVAKKLQMPMLILQGERDYQVTTVDFEGWQSALASRSNVQFKLYPDLNHLFIAGEGKIIPAEYGIEGHVAEQVIVDISEWIKATP